MSRSLPTQCAKTLVILVRSQGRRWQNYWQMSQNEAVFGDSSVNSAFPLRYRELIKPRGIHKGCLFGFLRSGGGFILAPLFDLPLFVDA